MSTVPSILYAPRHQAISAFLRVVVSPADYVDDGDMREFEEGMKFTLKVKTSQPGQYPSATDWICTARAKILGHATSDLVLFLKSLWPDTNWVKQGNEVIWVAARPTSLDVERELLRQFYSERSVGFSAA